MAACLIVTGYISGMRPAEVLHLRRGCCTQDASSETGPTRFRISGYHFKGVQDEDGVADPSGALRNEPWVVLPIVNNAIQTIEQLHDGEYLFGVEFPPHSHMRSATAPISSAVGNFWIRDFVEAGQRAADGTPAAPVIPAEDTRGQARPEGVTLRRFRRSIAWHIENQPGGSLALAQQYGHVSSLQSENYGKVGHAGLDKMMDMERAAHVRANLEALSQQRRKDGLGISGDPATRVAADLNSFEATFLGRVLSAREEHSLLSNRGLAYYNNDQRFAGCAFRASTAACRSGTSNVTAEQRSPNLSRCVESCANLFRTDEDVRRLQTHNDNLLEIAALPETPDPIAQRHRQQVELNLRKIHDHEQERLVIGPDEEQAP